MEEMAARAVVNGSSLGRLHPDFPMDPNTDRFERRLRASLERVKKALDELDGVVGYGQDLRGKMTEVRELVEEVRGGMRGARPEVAEECARQIEASEGVLARMVVRFSGAVPTSEATPTGASAAPADSAGEGFWLTRQTTSRLQANIDEMSSQPHSPTSRPLPPFQVAAEVYDVYVNRNSPSGTQVSSMRGQSGRSLSVASSRQEAQENQSNQINRRAREEEAHIDEEERDLEEQEAVDSANNAILAAKARSGGARARQELEDRRFQVAAARSELLARMEDDIANGMGSACGLDIESVGSWVDGTYRDGGPEGDNTTFVTNVTETVSANTDPYMVPFGATTVVAGCPAVSVTGRFNTPYNPGSNARSCGGHTVLDMSILDIPLPPPSPSSLPPPPHYTIPHHTAPYHHTIPHHTVLHHHHHHHHHHHTMPHHTKLYHITIPYHITSHHTTPIQHHDSTIVTTTIVSSCAAWVCEANFGGPNGCAYE
jgi:hypothetical protein